MLYLNRFNETVIRKTLREHDLKFTRLFMAKPHVFIGAANPLASRSSITLSDLEPYPRLSYEQGEHNSFYFSEENPQHAGQPQGHPGVRPRDPV